MFARRETAETAEALFSAEDTENTEKSAPIKHPLILSLIVLLVLVALLRVLRVLCREDQQFSASSAFPRQLAITRRRTTIVMTIRLFRLHV